MNVIFNSQAGKYQIVYSHCRWINPAIRGRPINDKFYDTQDEAWAYLDKISQ